MFFIILYCIIPGFTFTWLYLYPASPFTGRVKPFTFHPAFTFHLSPGFSLLYLARPLTYLISAFVYIFYQIYPDFYYILAQPIKAQSRFLRMGPPSPSMEPRKQKISPNIFPMAQEGISPLSKAGDEAATRVAVPPRL